ncbi:hypothetical protein Tco_0172613 [Tanacetum coccineum]
MDTRRHHIIHLLPEATTAVNTITKIEDGSCQSRILRLVHPPDMMAMYSIHWRISRSGLDHITWKSMEQLAKDLCASIKELAKDL